MYTKEEILNRMLDKADASYDKSEGSFLYDSLAAAALELGKAYGNLSAARLKLNVENLSGSELDTHVEEHTNLTRRQATKATTTVKIFGRDGAKIKKGDLVASDDSNYIIQEDKTIGETGMVEVKVEAENEGVSGNVPAGAIKQFPVTLQGTTSVTNENIVSNGYNAESDKSLLERYHNKIGMPATSGNKYHYKNWATEVDGVGDAKVQPIWNGAGTVKIVIIDMERKPATEELVDNVYQHIEENRPIGANVTVVSAGSQDIKIAAKVKVAEDYRIGIILEDFKKAIDDYRKSISFKDTYISLAAIGNILYTTKGVVDYNGLTLNNEESNIPLDVNEVPLFNVVELEVM